MLPPLSRRQLLQAASLGLLGTSASGLGGLLPLFADDLPLVTTGKAAAAISREVLGNESQPLDGITPQKQLG